MVDRLAAWGVALALATPALVLLISPQGYQVAWLLAGLLAAPQTVLPSSGQGRAPDRPDTPSRRFATPSGRGVLSLTAALALLVGWTALTLIWAADPEDGARRVGAAFAVLLSGVALVSAVARGATSSVSRAFVRALGIALALALIDRLTDGAVQTLTRPGEDWQVFTLNRVTVVIVLLLWPALALARGWIGRLGLTAGAVALVALGDSQTALVALIASALVFLVVRSARGAGMAAIVVAPMIVLLTPFLALALKQDVPSSWIAFLPELTGLIRLQIWHAAALLWWEGAGFLIGLGPDAIRAVTLPEIGWAYPEMRVSHPHNAYVQVALDLGLVGMALAALVAALTARAAARARRAPIHLATLAAAMAALGTAWNLWAMWWLATLGAVTLACVLAERR